MQRLPLQLCPGDKLSFEGSFKIRRVWPVHIFLVGLAALVIDAATRTLCLQRGLFASSFSLVDAATVRAVFSRTKMKIAERDLRVTTAILCTPLFLNYRNSVFLRERQNGLNTTQRVYFSSERAAFGSRLRFARWVPPRSYPRRKTLFERLVKASPVILIQLEFGAEQMQPDFTRTLI
jgi:hypothetical protein